MEKPVAKGHLYIEFKFQFTVELSIAAPRETFSYACRSIRLDFQLASHSVPLV